MLDSTISGTPRFATLPTEPDSTHTWYPSMSAIRADKGSKIFAARVHIEAESTLRNRSRARDIGASPCDRWETLGPSPLPSGATVSAQGVALPGGRGSKHVEGEGVSLTGQCRVNCLGVEAAEA